MKRIMSLAIAGVALVVLNGCKGTGGGSGSVDILDLYKGYVIEGEDQNHKNVELDFCSNKFTLYHDGADYSGTFSIGNGDYRINMFQKTPQTASYRIDTTDGQLHVDESYEIKYNGYDILIDTITKECRN